MAQVPFPRLHSSDAVRRLSSRVAPAAASGTTWSTWSTTPGTLPGRPQYRQRKPSRWRMRNRSWAGRGSRARPVRLGGRVRLGCAERGLRDASQRLMGSVDRRSGSTGLGAADRSVVRADLAAGRRPEPRIASSAKTTRKKLPVAVSDQPGGRATVPTAHASRTRRTSQPRQPRQPVTLRPVLQPRSRRAGPAASGARESRAPDRLAQRSGQVRRVSRGEPASAQTESGRRQTRNGTSRWQRWQMLNSWELTGSSQPFRWKPGAPPRSPRGAGVRSARRAELPAEHGPGRPDAAHPVDAAARRGR